MQRDVGKIADDVIFAKREIIQRLCNDADLIEVLNNPNLSPDCPDDYVGVNIFPYLRVPQTQDVVKNYICFSVDDTYADKENMIMKQQVVKFVVFSHIDDVETPYGVNRHDMLSYIVRDLFNWSNIFGMQLKLVYNIEDSMDNKYTCRTLKFEATKLNSPQRGVMTNRYEFKNV